VAPEIFSKSDFVLNAYNHLMSVVERFEDVEIEEKKTCAHAVAGGPAFLGIHPRKNGIRIKIVSDHRLEGNRIIRSEQMSRARFHNEVDIGPGLPIDEQLKTWIREAYELQHRG
jgi:hypothetical protein